MYSSDYIGTFGRNVEEIHNASRSRSPGHVFTDFAEKAYIIAYPDHSEDKRGAKIQGKPCETIRPRTIPQTCCAQVEQITRTKTKRIMKPKQLDIIAK